jgi:hypothetical protein
MQEKPITLGETNTSAETVLTFASTRPHPALLPVPAGRQGEKVEEGVNDSYHRLDELLDKMQKEEPSGRRRLRRAT